MKPESVPPAELTPRDTQRFADALASEDAAQKLIDLVEAMKLEGLDQLEIYAFFTVRYVMAQDEDNRREDDLLTEVLDLIWGWCRVEIRLFTRSLKNGEVWEYRKSQPAN